MNPLYFGRIYRFDRQAEPVTVSIPFGQGERFIVENVNDMLAHCTGPDGTAHCKELPSLRRAAATFRLLEAMVHAYRITSDEKYLKVATRNFAATDSSIDVQRRAKYLDDSGAVIAGEGRVHFFADRYTWLLLCAGTVKPLGLLDWYEYPYQGRRGWDSQRKTQIEEA